MHTAPRYPCSVPSQDRSELKPRVIGKEEEKRLSLPLASLLAHGENLSVLSLSPCTLVLYCWVKETVVTEAISKVHVLSNKSRCNWCPFLSCWGQSPLQTLRRVLWVRLWAAAPKTHAHNIHTREPMLGRKGGETFPLELSGGLTEVQSPDPCLLPEPMICGGTKLGPPHRWT